MNHDEISELLGAYALDAVDPDESAIISDHLAGCPRCSAELAEHREVAGLLGGAGGDAPARLWDGIAAAATRPAPAAAPAAVSDFAAAAATRDASRPRQSRAHRWAMGVAAVAVAIALVAGAQVVRLQGRVDNLSAASAQQGLARVALLAMLDPTAKLISLHATSQATPAVAELVVLPSGTSFLINRKMAPLGAGETYQLWGIVHGRAISLSVLGATPQTVPFALDPTSAVTVFAVTAERSGGAVAPTSAPVAKSDVLRT